MKCPVCRAPYQSKASEQNAPVLNCRRCGADLAPLIHLHDQALWHHRQAIQCFEAGDYDTAIAQNDQAIALHTQQAEFHALAGQLRALQGDFGGAIAAWRMAQQLDPQNPIVMIGLQILKC